MKVFWILILSVIVTVFLPGKTQASNNVKNKLDKAIKELLKGFKCSKLCPPGRRCEVNGEEEICACVSKCRPRRKPVCGTDGKLYKNHCELHRMACVTGKRISIDWSDTCRRLKITKNKCDKNSLKALKKRILVHFSKELLTKFSPEKRIELLFHRRDNNEDKKLNRRELASLMLDYVMYEDLRPSLRLCGVEDWIECEDKNRDGVLSKNEFYSGFDHSELDERPTEPNAKTEKPELHTTTAHPEPTPAVTPSAKKESTTAGPIIHKVEEVLQDSESNKKDKVTKMEPKVIHSKNVFFVFASDGIYVINPVTSSIVYHIRSNDVIKDTESPVCTMDKEQACSWGSAVHVENKLIYAADPLGGRLIVIDTASFIVVEEIKMMGYPYDVQYVSSLDEIWVLCWGSSDVTDVLTEEVSDNGTINVISHAGTRIQHTVTRVPNNGTRLHLIHSLHVTDGCHLRDEQRYGYVTHLSEPGIHEIDLAIKEFTRFINLSSDGCYGTYGYTYSSAAYYGFVQCFTNAKSTLRAQYPINLQTETVLSVLTINTGLPHISPDGRFVVSLNDYTVSTLFVDYDQTIQIGEPIKTNMRLSDVAFLARDDGYDLYVTSKDTSAVIVLHASPSGIETIKLISDLEVPTKAVDGVHTQRSIVIGCEDDSRYLATSADDAILILDGQRQAISGHVPGIKGAGFIVWVAEEES